MLPFTPSQHSLAAKLERFEEGFAILRNERSGELKWPLDSLPGNIKIGDIVMLKLSTEASEEEEKYARMRKLLEELIN